MIDTDKYEGHAKGPWYWDDNLCNDEHSDKHGREQWAVLDWELGVEEINERLIADAPLLLAEVKRLQAWKNEMTDIINEAKDKVNTDDSRPRAIWWNLQYKLKEMIE